MNTLDSLFPESPVYNGNWQTLYLEPIVGSGEKIAIAAVALGNDGESKVIQAIRTELLDCLYGSQSENMQGMINWVIESVKNEISQKGTLSQWQPPFSGLDVGTIHKAADENIEGILRQAIRFTASLSNLALDADRDSEDIQPKKQSEKWSRSVAEELKIINPQLSSCFNQKVKVSKSNIMTTYGFYSDTYVTNFGLLVPTRLSGSLSTVKAKLLDLESFKKSSLLIKPEQYEIIIGTPSFDDPTLSDKSINRLKETIDMVSEIAEKEGVQLYHTDNAEQAARHINDVAA
jgi:hypothetical protein